jgi:hypothetical protein
VYHEAGRSDFEVNFKKSWAEGDQIGGISDMTAGDGYVELPLTGERRALLASIDNELIVQFYKGDDKAAFNVTEIALVAKEDGGATAVENTTVSEKAVKTIVDGQIVIIKNGVRYNTLGAQLR